MKNQLYKTRDIALAASLMIDEEDPAEITLEHEEGRRFTFVTNLDYHTGKAREYKYYNRQVQVAAYDFYQALRTLKGRVYDELKRKGIPE